MQQASGNASQQHSWGSADGTSGQPQVLNPFDLAPFQQPQPNRWAPIGPANGMPTLRSIMQEEQQAAMQSHAAQPQPVSNPTFNSYQYANQTLPRAPPGLTMPPAMQQQPQQQQARQRSAGFYMNSQSRDEQGTGAAAAPATNSWAQLLRPNASNGQQNGHVDLRMATEAFRDAFSATAPPMHGPAEMLQDPLLLEAFKTPVNHVTGKLLRFLVSTPQSPCKLFSIWALKLYRL